MFDFVKKFIRRTPQRVRAPAASEPTPVTALSSAPAVSPRFAAKLKIEEQHRLCELLGEFKTAPEIQAIFRAETNKELPLSTIRDYRQRPSWQAVIAKARQDYTARLAEVPSFHKRVRLERLERQYEAVIGEGGNDHPKRRREIREILANAREETQGASTTNVLIANIQGLSDEELEVRRQAVMKQIVAFKAEPEGTHASQE